MPLVLVVTALLIGATTLLHYEALQALNARLASLGIAARPKVLVVVFGAFVAHVAEIALYGAGYYALITHAGGGALEHARGGGVTGAFDECLYFSGATYTSLGLGDLAPTGPVRLLATAEALHGLMLIGWTASFLYIAMDRFWRAGVAGRRG